LNKNEIKKITGTRTIRIKTWNKESGRLDPKKVLNQNV
jgi:hypothetical protein